MPDLIDSTYLPFTPEQLRSHFIIDVDGQIEYYKKSAARYHKYMVLQTKTAGIPLTKARYPRQIEKDERFWTVTALKQIFDDPARDSLFTKLLSETYGKTPPIAGMTSWKECLNGDLKLYFEACLASPSAYANWLRTNLTDRQMIPYVLDAARRKSARALEGATHVDALLLNLSNGFSWLIEAKVLSDISCLISFDHYRNQIARNLDVMLDNTSQPGSGLENRDPDSSLFSLLTPGSFKRYPTSRLYGWLMHEYGTDPNALKRDLGHREEMDWVGLSRRIGWLTFEDFERIRPGACPWLL